jgi:hypothetical protein
MRNVILALFMALFAMGCATANLSDGGRRVRFVSVTPHNCQYVSEVSGSYHGDSVSSGIVINTSEMAHIDMKNQAAKLGADTVELSSDDSGYLSGEAYKCGDLSLQRKLSAQ